MMSGYNHSLNSNKLPMNNNENYKIRLGLFVTAGIVLFAIAIFYIGRQKNLFNSTIRLTAVFGNVSGLQVGNNVRFSGINVGTVDNVSILTDTSVMVEMIIDKGPQRYIKKDSYATIGSEGLMGDKVITLTQGTPGAPSVQSGDLVLTNDPVETDQIISSLQVSGENAEIVTSQLAEILFKINNGSGTLGRLISDTTIAENIERTIANLESGSKGLSQNMEAAKSNVLLRGYYRKQKRKAEAEAKKKEEEAKKKEEEKKAKWEKDAKEKGK
jgi:phospholipid/cholesterol/gamma-HCH transport system substrate-binding protein